jgi:hypothetical protein
MRFALGHHTATVERMTIQRLENVGIVADDLAAVTTFFVELGLELQAKGRSKTIGWTAWWGSRASGRTSRCWRPRTATDGWS